MNRYLLALIATLLLGLTGSYFYQHHGLAAIYAHFPGAPVAVKPIALQAQCGCVADTDEVLPTTPQQLKQAKAEEKRRQVQEKVEEKQIALRLHRLVRVGMSRKQVGQIMGEPNMTGTPEVTVIGHPSEDADYFGDYQVAYTANDTVTSISPI